MAKNRVIRAAVGVIVLLIVFTLVANWVGDYRSATKGRTGASASEVDTSTATGGTASGSSSKSSTTKSENTASKPSTQVLVVTVDGLNFREEPNSQSKAMRGLSKGEKVTLLATEGDWYKVRDANQVVGYITSSPTYTDPAK